MYSDKIITIMEIGFECIVMGNEQSFYTKLIYCELTLVAELRHVSW